MSSDGDGASHEATEVAGAHGVTVKLSRQQKEVVERELPGSPLVRR